MKQGDRLAYAVFFLCLSLLPVVSRAEVDKVPLEEVQKAVTQAIKNKETEEREKNQEFISQLSADLHQMAEDWIAAQEKEKEAQLDQKQHNDWADLQEYVSPVPYDYYLRNYSYALDKIDLKKTNSLLNPYQGSVDLRESLFIENYHADEASDLSEYLYTVIRPIKINLEYRDGEFTVSHVDNGSPSIGQGWPKEK